MDFMTAARTGFGKITDMSGKAGRAEFWWYVLAVIIAEIVISIILNMFLPIMTASLLTQIVGIVLIFSATIRRLNDVGRPATWAYAYFALSILTTLLAVMGMTGIITSLVGLATLILLIVMIYFLVQPSAGAGN